MAAVLTDTTIAPRSRFVKQTGRLFCSPSPGGVKRSPAADAGLGCSKNRPLRARTGGSGGHFALGVVAPRRPFCPLSAGGKWTNAPPRKRGGGPGRFDRLGRRKDRLPAAGRRHSPPKPAFADSRRPMPHSRRASEHTDCKFSPSVACGDSSLVRGSQALRGVPSAGAKPCGGSLSGSKGFSPAFLRFPSCPPAENRL